MTDNKEGLFNQVKINSKIVFGNGQRLSAECIGEKRGVVVHKNGTKVPILMKNVKYVPLMYCNLFSITAALKEGCKLEGSSKGLKISKGNKTYMFDRKVKSGNASLFAMKISNEKKT